MKLFVPIALALFTVACAPPKPGTAAHQQQLAEEARAHFYALKAQGKKPTPAVPSSSFVPTAATATTPPPQKYQPTGSTFNAPFANPFAKTPPKPVVKWNPPAAAQPATLPPADDTLYYYDMPGGPEPTSARYRARKIQYARELGKRPEDLTSAEREWVRGHYRD